MPRGRKRSHKFKLKKDSVKSAFAISLAVLGGLSFISVFTNSGFLLKALHNLGFGFFGFGFVVAPAAVIVLALLMLKSIKWKFVEIRVLLGLILLVFCIAPFSAFIVANDAGGAIGLYIAEMLRQGVTIYGGFLILLAGFAMSAILIFDISIDQIVSALASSKKKIAVAAPSFPKKNTPAVIDNNQQGFEDDNENGKTQETSFEVIPTVSEPIDAKNLQSTQSVHNKPNLPYADKVWEYPPVEILADAAGPQADRGDVKMRQQIIEKTLSSFGINARVAEINYGPAVTQYALETVSGTKIAKITNLQHDIALALASPTGSVRIEAPIPGKSLIGIEVPNIQTAVVNFKSMVTSDIMKSAKSKLTISLGHNVAGLPCVSDIAKMPHMLIAGSTGSGKSVFLHSVMFSLLFRCSPSECKFILVDPKRVELVNYKDIPHLLVPVITDADKAPVVFRWAVSEMERRYKLFENAKVRNINAYNELSGFQALSYIVVVVDELAELMALQPVEMEKTICRLAQLSRATGLHLILATQRPSVDVLTGLIKANIPTRIAFNVTSQIDSRVIIDTVGAEKLLGKGDMLYVPPDASKPIRIQGVFVSDKEISNLVTFLKQSGVTPEYREEIIQPAQVRGGFQDATDELFDEAIKIISLNDKASASLLQRKLSIGYARAARLLDELEARGIVSEASGSKPRDVLIRNPDNVPNPAPGDD